MPKMNSLIAKTSSHSQAMGPLNQPKPSAVRCATWSPTKQFICLLVLLACSTGTTFPQRLPVCNTLDYGAKADGQTVNTAAINQAIQACAKGGGGTAYVPSGTYLTGTIVMVSNITLHLEAGAVLKGSSNLSDYSMNGEQRHGLIFAQNAGNIAITGHGVVDGNGTQFMDLNKRRIEDDFDGKFTRQGKKYMYGDPDMGDGPVLPKDRPGNLIVLSDCRNILIRDITIKDSPLWTLHLADCDHVNLTGIVILNGLAYANNDGIHCTTSRNIHISDCDISAGDDAICVTGFGQKKGVAENVTVNNCTLQSRSSGIRVGYGDNSIRNCVFQNLVIYGSNRGVGVFARDRGSIENILFSNITIETRLHTGHWWGHGEPLHVSAVPLYENIKAGEIKNIRFSNIIARGESGIVVYALKESPIQNLTLEQIHLAILPTPLSASYGGNFDLRPVLDKALAIFKHDVPGVFCRYVNGIKIQDFELHWVNPQADYLTHGIECENFQDLLIDGFRGRQALPGGKAAAIALNHGGKVIIRNCEALEGTETFLLHSDLTDQRLFVNNDLSKARRAFQPDKVSFTSSGNILPPK